MSTLRPGSPGTTPERCIPIGESGWEVLLPDTSDLASIQETSALLSLLPTPYAEWQREFWALYVARLLGGTARSISTPEESTYRVSSSTTPRCIAVPWYSWRVRLTPSPSGTSAYQPSPSTGRGSPSSRFGSLTESTLRSSTPPTTWTRQDGELTVTPSEPSSTDWSRAWSGHWSGGRM